MPTSSRFRRSGRRGRLLAVGGAEDPDEARLLLLPHLMRRAGGRRARLLICAAPTDHASKTLRAYRRVFDKIGIGEVASVSLNSRNEASDARSLAALERATGIYFTGGDQLRLTSVLAGTPFGTLLRERFHAGLFVAGTSAGAAALAGTMIIGGRGSLVSRDSVELAPGLGLWEESVIDTHFNREGRVHRLMAALAMNPGVLGIGLDEDTAVDISSTGKLTVVGRGNVMIFDGRVAHTNVADVGDSDPIALLGSTLHVLSPGYALDLRSVSPMVPDRANGRLRRRTPGKEVS